MDHTVSPQSRATYSRQGGRLLDLCMVDNSHSVASASSDGTVHVRETGVREGWRGSWTSRSGRNVGGGRGCILFVFGQRF